MPEALDKSLFNIVFRLRPHLEEPYVDHCGLEITRRIIDHCVRHEVERSLDSTTN